MVSIIPKRADTDTRGLPAGYDPHKFYEYAISQRMKTANGLEWLLLKYMPHSVIRSFAIAIDPLSNLKLTSAPVTPGNRNRSRVRSSVLDLQKVRYFTYNVTKGTIPNWNNQTGVNSPMIFVLSEGTVDQTVNASSQPGLQDRSKDTTRRTRVLGSELGEFEKQTHQIFSPGRSVYYSSITDSRVTPSGPNTQVSISESWRSATVGPFAAFFTTNDFNNLREQELQYAKTLIGQNVLSMFNEVSPIRRNYSLFRNIVELRDLPSSVVSLQRSLANLRSLGSVLINDPKLSRVIHSFETSVKDVPNEYLSYMFGWRQTYKDIVDLLGVPDKITKQINFLIRRSGKDTTLRYRRRIPTVTVVGPSGFRYFDTTLEDMTSKSSYLEREAELRIVCNAQFQFPDVMSPRFADKLFYEKLGLYPTPTDLYNLVPWTWLIDWFTGLGDYVSAIDNINRDPKLVNWSLITCELHSNLRTVYKSRTAKVRSWVTGNPSGSGSSTSYTWNTHESILSLKTNVRRDVTTAMQGVRTTANISSLTLYQQSILGSLLAQRTKFSK